MVWEITICRGMLLAPVIVGLGLLLTPWSKALWEAFCEAGGDARQWIVGLVTVFLVVWYLIALGICGSW